MCLFVCLTVCLSTTIYSRTTGYEAAYERYQQLQCYKGIKSNVAILLKRLRSRDMAKKPICIMSTGLPRPGSARSAHRERIKLLRGYVSKSSPALNPLTITQLACERPRGRSRIVSRSHTLTLARRGSGLIQYIEFFPLQCILQSNQIFL